MAAHSRFAQKPSNGRIQIDVEDTGQGIPLEQLDKIFDLFVSTKEEGDRGRSRNRKTGY